MITNIVKNKKNYLSTNYYDNASKSISDMYFSCKDDGEILLEVGNDIDKLTLYFSTLQLQDFKSLEITWRDSDKHYFDYYRCEYSIDNSNWFELPWSVYVNESGEKVYRYITKYIEGTKEKTKIVDYLDLNDMGNNYAVTNENIISESISAHHEYVYTKNNLNNKEEYLYTDLKFMYFKVIFYNVSPPVNAPFVITDVKIYSDEDFEHDDIDMLDLTYNNYYRQRLYESENFIPIQSKTFFDMLEYNTDNHRFDLQMDINILATFGIGYMRINSQNVNDRFIINAYSD